MIEHISEQNLGAALDLLAAGFRARPRSYWEHAAERISAFGGNAALNLPIGLLMRDGDRATGVAFTIASQRPHGEQSLSYVNFAAWYVEEDQRWRAPLMLRALTRLKCDVITDLTPSKAVQPLLPVFGFKAITTGYALNVTAFHGGDGVVEALDAGPGVDFPLKEVLLAHGAFGAIPAVLRASDGAATPLLFKPGRFRGLRVKQNVMTNHMTKPSLKKTPPKRGAYHHGDLRRTLLDAAREEIAASGAQGLSLSSLARRAGVAQSAPYRHSRIAMNCSQRRRPKVLKRSRKLCALPTRVRRGPRFDACARLISVLRRPTPNSIG
jgi:hypothetical protein